MPGRSTREEFEAQRANPWEPRPSAFSREGSFAQEEGNGPRQLSPSTLSRAWAVSIGAPTREPRAVLGVIRALAIVPELDSFPGVFGRPPTTAELTEIAGLRKSLSESGAVVLGARDEGRNAVQAWILEVGRVAADPLVIVGHSTVDASGARLLRLPSGEAIPIDELHQMAAAAGVDLLVVTCHSPDLGLERRIGYRDALRFLEAAQSVHAQAARSHSTATVDAPTRRPPRPYPKGSALGAAIDGLSRDHPELRPQLEAAARVAQETSTGTFRVVPLAPEPAVAPVASAVSGARAGVSTPRRWVLSVSAGGLAPEGGRVWVLESTVERPQAVAPVLALLVTALAALHLVVLQIGRRPRYELRSGAKLGPAVRRFVTWCRVNRLAAALAVSGLGVVIGTTALLLREQGLAAEDGLGFPGNDRAWLVWAAAVAAALSGVAIAGAVSLRDGKAFDACRSAVSFIAGIVLWLEVAVLPSALSVYAGWHIFDYEMHNLGSVPEGLIAILIGGGFASFGIYALIGSLWVWPKVAKTASARGREWSSLYDLTASQWARGIRGVWSYMGS